MSDNKICAVTKQPHEQAQTVAFENKLHAFQRFVGGYIECIPFPDMEDVDIVLNEEGKLSGLEPNVMCKEYRDILVGNLIVVGVDPEEGEWKSLELEQVKKVSDYLNKNSLMGGSGVVVCMDMNSGMEM